MNVTSFPSGAEVWIDGTPTGKTTPAILLVATGEHQVMAKAPEGGWAPAQKSVVVARGLNAVSLTLVPEVVQGPPGPPGPQGPAGAGIPENVTVQVDCGAGEAIGPVLSTPALYLTIVVLGVCELPEGLVIGRENVTLMGGAPGAGLHSSNEIVLLGVYGTWRLFIRDLSLQGGRVALQVGGGANVGVARVDISGAAYGLQVVGGAIVQFRDGWIHDNSISGVDVRVGAAVVITGSEIHSHSTGVVTYGGVGVSVQGGHAEISRTTIRDNSFSGIWAYGGAVVYLNDSTVTRNGTALSLSQGSSAAVRTSRLAASTGAGVSVDGGSALTLWAGAIVEDSGRFAGVSASGNSSIIMQDQSAVQGNRGDGIKLSETAELFLNDTPLIENNEGWGVVCVPVPDVPGIHGGWGLDPAKIGPNGAGRISCPGLTAP